MKIITNVLRAVFLFTIIFLSFQGQAQTAGGSGDQAAATTTVSASADGDMTADGEETGSVRGKVNWLLVIVAVLLFAIVALVLDILGLVGDIQGKQVINWININAIMLLGFIIIGLGAVFWEYSAHAKYTVNAMEPASEHGHVYDSMFNITFILTGVMFIITQVLLFWYGYKYKFSKNRKALYYPDNHKLEFIWTIIPAIVLTVLVIRGLKTWNEIMYSKSDDAEVIEVFGYQFGWSIRYAGTDNKLGAHDFRQIGVENAFGVSSKDPKAADDVVANELHLKAGKPIVLKFRAKDVIHSAYLPHFRVQMNVVPGLPTQFSFTPTITTAEMRVKTNNPNFDYILLCNKICGGAHYRMKMKVVVDSPAEYAKWMESQPKLVQNDAAAEPKAPAVDSPAVVPNAHTSITIPATGKLASK